LRWSKDNKCKIIISIAGKVIEKKDKITRVFSEGDIKFSNYNEGIK
jgi:hypothetical protein